MNEYKEEIFNLVKAGQRISDKFFDARNRLDLSSAESPLIEGRILEQLRTECKNWYSEILVFTRPFDRLPFSIKYDLEKNQLPQQPIFLFGEDSQRQKEKLLRFIEEVRAGISEKISRLNNIADTNPANLKTKPSIIISKTKGIVSASDSKKLYPIAGGRKKVLYALESGSQTAAFLALKAWSNKNTNQVTKAVGKINELFAEKLEICEKLIDHSDSLPGYFLNEEGIEIKWEK